MVRSSQPFAFFRKLVEATGVWVFLRSFKQKDVNGFGLNHEQFPVIYLNSAKNYEQRILTMFNEWAHIGFDFNHIELSDRQRYLNGLTEVDYNIEVSCLQFSAKHTQSAASGAGGRASHLHEFGRTVSFVGSFAFFWQGHQAAWDVENSESGNGEGKGPGAQGYYAIQKSRLGERYIRAAFEAFEAERIDEHQLAATLGVKGQHLQRLGNDAWR